MRLCISIITTRCIMNSSEKSAIRKTQNRTLGTNLLIIFVIYSAIVLMATTATVLTSFYPHEANNRNLSASQYGFVVGVFDLVTFLSSIPVGKMAHKYSPRTLFGSGIFLLSFSAVAFACLILVEDGLLFLLLSLSCRIVQGLTKSLINITMFAAFPLLFPENAVTYISWGESIFGIGEVLGPGLGGPLYHIGGFPMPFVVIGVLCFLLLPLAWYYLPTSYSEKETKSASFFWEMFIMGRLWICFGFSAVVDCYAMFLVATFEPGIRFLNLSSAEVGLVFALLSVAYALFTAVFGRLCDKGVCPLYFFIVGGFSGASGCAILAFSNALYQVVLGLLLIGIGHAGLYLPSLVYVTKVCLSKGYPDSIETHGMVSGFFMAFISFGAFVGPTVGGFIFDALGFQISNLIFSGVHLLAGIVISFILTIDTCT